MQWGIHSFAVGGYSQKKLNNIIECVCDAMFVIMVPSVEGKGEQKCFLDHHSI